VLLLSLFLMVNVNSSAQARDQTGRPLTLDDLFSLQQSAPYYGGAFALSPDGQQLAFAIQRPKNTATSFTLSMAGNDRADVYVVSSSGGKPVNITNGLQDGAGYWAPSWSPDGKRLAMLSTKGGNVHPWVWDRTSGSLRQVTDRAVDLYSVPDRPYVWASPTRLLIPVLPPGMKPDWFLGYTLGAEKAEAEWPKTWTGKGGAVSVLTSGATPDISKRPQAGLMAVDVETGRNQIITNGAVRNIVVSPDQKSVAYARQIELYRPEGDDPLPLNELFNNRAGKFELAIISTDGVALLQSDPITSDVVPLSLRWAPNSEELAFLAYAKNKTKALQLVRFTMSNHVLTVTQIDDVDPVPLAYQMPQLEWTRRGWIIYASKQSENNTLNLLARRDWWLASEDGSLRSITSKLITAPTKLWRETGRDSYVGLADGELWRISAQVAPENLTATLDKRIESIVWPPATSEMETPEASAEYRQIIVTVQGTEQQLFALDLASGQSTILRKPATNAKVAGFSPNSQATVYYSNDRSGLRLWLAQQSGTHASAIYEANSFLQDVTPGIPQKIAYRSLDGQELNGWVLLPSGYHRGDKCPLVVWVYPGRMAGTEPGRNMDITFPWATNLQLLAARGYAVLEPSIPINPLGSADDPLMKLTSGVLPAVDKLIDMGIADPKRIFAMGHSNGGYAIYGLISQTNRFKAAVAMAGYSDLVSGYGQFGNLIRYIDHADEELTRTQQPTIETVLNLGSPPWKDMGRYLRNSPIFYVDRVKTPVLIIHGDMDGVPIEQAEEIFMALYRQGKRAEFVRYWGEGHVVDSPPNIRDMWARIFAWFEEFSRPPKG
jgi:dipeptidyl aminopeptidase/acylaminoacyl peptidase